MDIYLAPHGSGLQQGGGPRPLRHKGGGGQPRIHVPAGIKGNVQGILTNRINISQFSCRIVYEYKGLIRQEYENGLGICEVVLL